MLILGRISFALKSSISQFLYGIIKLDIMFYYYNINNNDILFFKMLQAKSC